MVREGLTTLPPLTAFEAGPIALNSFRQIVNHWLGDIVESGLWLSPARQATQVGGPVQQTYALVDHIPQSRTNSLACDLKGGVA